MAMSIFGDFKIVRDKFVSMLTLFVTSNEGKQWKEFQAILKSFGVTYLRNGNYYICKADKMAQSSPATGRQASAFNGVVFTVKKDDTVHFVSLVQPTSPIAMSDIAMVDGAFDLPIDLSGKKIELIKRLDGVAIFVSKVDDNLMTRTKGGFELSPTQRGIIESRVKTAKVPEGVTIVLMLYMQRPYLLPMNTFDERCFVALQPVSVIVHQTGEILSREVAGEYCAGENVFITSPIEGIENITDFLRRTDIDREMYWILLGGVVVSACTNVIGSRYLNARGNSAVEAIASTAMMMSTKELHESGLIGLLFLYTRPLTAIYGAAWPMLMRLLSNGELGDENVGDLFLSLHDNPEQTAKVCCDCIKEVIECPTNPAYPFWNDAAVGVWKMHKCGRGVRHNHTVGNMEGLMSQYFFVVRNTDGDHIVTKMTKVIPPMDWFLPGSTTKSRYGRTEAVDMDEVNLSLNDRVRICPIACATDRNIVPMEYGKMFDICRGIEMKQEYVEMKFDSLVDITRQVDGMRNRMFLEADKYIALLRKEERDGVTQYRLYDDVEDDERKPVRGGRGKRGAWRGGRGGGARRG